MTRILLTGATGFVGSHVAPILRQRGHHVVEAVRTITGRPDAVAVSDIGPHTDWSRALDGIEAVVHLAAIAHRAEREQGGMEAFRRVNAEGTERLAAQARASGVRLFVHMSSVYAREYEAGRAPDGPYGHSKKVAEDHALAFAGEGRASVVLRPPLVYGVGAKANWRALMRLAASPFPLPFAGVDNRRSLVSVDNLADAIAAVIARAPTGSARFEIADGPPVSLRDTLAWLRRGMGKSIRLFRIPSSAFTLASAIPGLERPLGSLTGDLIVDPVPFNAAFAWSAPESTEAAITRCGQAWIQRSSSA